MRYNNRTKILKSVDFVRSSSSEIWTTKLKSWLEIIAASTVLILVMGVPAAVIQYSSLNIPLSLLSYRRTLEAGITPSFIIILFMLYLMYIEKKPKGRQKVSLLITYPAIPIMIPALIIIIFLFLSLSSYEIWTIGWIITRPLKWFVNEFILSNLELLGIGIIPPSLILITVFFLKIRKKKKKHLVDSKYEKKSDIQKDNNKKQRSPHYFDSLIEPKSINQWLFISIPFFYLSLPLLIVGGLFFIRLTFSFYELYWPIIIKPNIIWILGLFMGIAYAHYMTCMAPILNLKEEDKNKLNFGRKFSYLLFVLICVFIYSSYLYPNLPRKLGGGKPQVVNILLRSEMFPSNFFSGDTISNIDNKKIIKLSNVLLIDIDSNELIICKKIHSQMKGFLLSRGSVTALYW